MERFDSILLGMRSAAELLGHLDYSANADNVNGQKSDFTVIPLPEISKPYGSRDWFGYIFVRLDNFQPPTKKKTLNPLFPLQWLSQFCSGQHPVNNLKNPKRGSVFQRTKRTKIKLAIYEKELLHLKNLKRNKAHDPYDLVLETIEIENFTKKTKKMPNFHCLSQTR